MMVLAPRLIRGEARAPWTLLSIGSMATNHASNMPHRPTAVPGSRHSDV